eukprot:scaffold12214_cov33-Attheya_sp.AAC.7
MRRHRLHDMDETCTGAMQENHNSPTSRLCSSCRHWPEIHKLRVDGGLGRMCEINPNRVAMTLARDRPLVWYVR